MFYIYNVEVYGVNACKRNYRNRLEQFQFAEVFRFDLQLNTLAAHGV